VRRSALDEFLAAGEMAGEAPDIAATPTDTSGSAEAWTALGARLADCSAALADEDLAILSQALASLADAASRLADALPAQQPTT
jgi:hypothetical protein